MWCYNYYLSPPSDPKSTFFLARSFIYCTTKYVIKQNKIFTWETFRVPDNPAYYRLKKSRISWKTASSPFLSIIDGICVIFLIGYMLVLMVRPPAEKEKGYKIASQASPKYKWQISEAPASNPSLWTAKINKSKILSYLCFLLLPFLILLFW